jgi:hypothetical protein
LDQVVMTPATMAPKTESTAEAIAIQLSTGTI